MRSPGAPRHVLSPRNRAQSSLQSFAEGVSTSYDSDVRAGSARRIDANTVSVVLTFTSVQTSDKGPDGDVCDIWTLEYRMIQGAAGRWFIDDALAVNGRTHTTC